MRESRDERSALGASLRGARVDVGLNLLSPKTQLLNLTSKQAIDPSTISASDFAK